MEYSGKKEGNMMWIRLLDRFFRNLVRRGNSIRDRYIRPFLKSIFEY